MNEHVRITPGPRYTPRQLPDGITNTQSYTWVLREIFADLAMSLPFFQGFNLRKNKRRPIVVADLPILGFYLIDETMTGDGEPNEGEIRFLHTFRLALSVLIRNNDEDDSEQKLDAAFWALMNGLWRNEYVMSRLDTGNPHIGGVGNPDNTRFEAIVRGTRKHVFGAIGLNQETATAELQYDVSVTYRAEFGAIVNDDWNTLDVKAFPGNDVTDPNSVPLVEWAWDFTTGGPPVIKPLSAKEQTDGSQNHPSHKLEGNPQANATPPQGQRGPPGRNQKS
jgi:hypothetical protein